VYLGHSLPLDVIDIRQLLPTKFYAYLSPARNSLIGTEASLPRLSSSGDLEALSKHVLHTGVTNQVLSFRKDLIFLRIYNDNNSHSGSRYYWFRNAIE